MSEINKTATGVAIMRESMMTRFRAMLHHMKDTAMNECEIQQWKWIESAVNSEPAMLTEALEFFQKLLDARIQNYVRYAVDLGEIRGFLQR